MPDMNRDALRRIINEWPDGGGPDLCEWDPLRQMPSRLKDPYHGVASVRMVAIVDGDPCHVCVRCAEHTSQRLLVRADVPVHGQCVTIEVTKDDPEDGDAKVTKFAVEGELRPHYSGREVS